MVAKISLRINTTIQLFHVIINCIDTVTWHVLISDICTTPQNSLPYNRVTNLLTTSQRIVQFSDGKEPKVMR